MSKSRGIDGNAIGSQLEFERQMVRTATQILRFERVLERLDNDGLAIRGMSVRIPGYDRADYLVVVRADAEAGPVVCFISSDTLGDVIRKTVAQLENGSAKWREDEYAKQG